MPGPLVKLMSVGVNQKPFQFNFKPNAVQNEYLESFRGVENSGLSTGRRAQRTGNSRFRRTAACRRF